MSGSGANLPINIRLNGTAEAEAAFNRVSTTAGTAMQRVGASTDQASQSTGRFGQVVGQAGFQIQDFAGQVSAGTSALTALSQQGSQLLGVFGTGGAVAGAVLTVGILAVQLAGLADNADKLKDALDGLDESYRATDTAARQYRDSLDEEARRIRDLTAFYGSLSEAVQVYERRRLEGQANTIRIERDRRVGEITGPLDRAIFNSTGARNDFDPLTGEALGLSEGARAATTELEQARQAIEAFQAATVPTRDSIAELANRLTVLAEASGTAGGPIRAVLAAITANEAALLRTGEGMEQLRQRMVAAGVPIEEVNRLLGQSTLNADQLTAALGRLRNAANNPITNLGTSLSNVNEELRALRTGGVAEADRIVRQQRAEAAAQAAMARAEAFVRGNSGLGGTQLEEAIAEARAEAEGLSRAVSDGEAARDRLREQLTAAGRAAREASQEFQDLRRHTSGLLVGNTSDVRNIEEITRQIRGTALDPAIRQRAEAEAQRTAEREADRRQAEADRFTQNWGDRIALETTRGLFEGTRNGESAAQRFGNALRNILMSSVSAVLSRNLFQPLVSAGLNSVGGGGLGGFLGLPAGAMGGAGAVADAGGMQAGLTQAGQVLGLRSAGGFGNLGNAFTGQGLANTGFGFVDSALNAQLMAPSLSSNGMIGAGGIPIVDGSAGLSVAGAIGGAASIAGGAYGIYSGLQRGGIGGYTTAAGGALSAGLGAAMLAGATIPVAGWVLAGLLAIAGAALPGQQQSGRGQLSRINLNTANQTFEGLGGDRFSQGNRDAATNTVNSIAELARRIGDQLGGARIGGDVAVGVTSSRGSGPGTLYLQIGANTQQFANDEAGSKQLAETAARLILDEFRRQGRAQGDYAGILAASPTVEVLSQNLEWYEKTYKVLTQATEPVSAFQQSIDQLTAQFEPAITKARELGLSVDAMTAAREREIAKLEEQKAVQLTTFATNLDVRRLRAQGAGEAADFMAFDLNAEAERRSARESLQALGVTGDALAERMLWLENTLADERLAIQRNYAEQAAAVEQQAAAERQRIAEQSAGAQLASARTILDYLNGQALGATSSLSPTARLAEAERQFNAALAGGDARALTSAADALLTNSRDVFGGATAQFAQRETFVRQTLLNRGTAATNDSATVAALSQMTAALTAELASLREGFAALVAEQRRMNDKTMLAA